MGSTSPQFAVLYVSVNRFAVAPAIGYVRETRWGIAYKGVCWPESCGSWLESTARQAAAALVPCGDTPAQGPPTPFLLPGNCPQMDAGRCDRHFASAPRARATGPWDSSCDLRDRMIEHRDPW